MFFGATKVDAKVNPENSIDTLQIGQKLDWRGEEYVKYNGNQLLMLSSTLTCPHGKRIAGQWAKCFDCPNDATYDSTHVTCACNNNNLVYNWDAGVCMLSDIPSDADRTNCVAPIAYMDD